jgi:putative DNA primase/helicase
VVQPDTEILATTLKDAKFARLWSGAWEGMYRSHSEADQSLCNKLVFYFGGDAGKVDALFRQSGLMRPKWNREKYRTGTIEKALTDVTERYRPGESKPSPDLHRCATARSSASFSRKNAQPRR